MRVGLRAGMQSGLVSFRQRNARRRYGVQHEDQVGAGLDTGVGLHLGWVLGLTVRGWFV